MSGSKISQPVTNRGFTIVELLIIAPIVILFLGGFITAIVNMTGDVLASRSSSALVYDIQDSLDRIEQDVKLSSTFLAINNITPLTSPQGYNNDTTNFTNIDSTKGDMLILNSLATNGNPLLATSSLFYLDDQPNDCTSTQINQNIPMTMNIVYFVKDSSLWRRVIAPANYNTAGCPVPPALPWQQPSCNPTFMIDQPGSSTFCKAQDAKLLDSVDPEDFVVRYFNTADATTANSVASNDPDPAVRNTALQAATTVSASLNIDKIAAGRTVNQSGTIRVTRLDINASTIAPVVTPTTPAAPTVAVSHSSPVSAVFTWPTVPGATGYTFQYRINGGSWQTAFTNQNTTTYTATADHEDVVEGRASATNSAGTSGYSSLVSLTIPLWANLLLQNNWTDYGSTYTTAAYTKTKDGVVLVKGLIKRTGTAVGEEVVGNLPVGYRPSASLMFGGSTNSNTTSRIDVNANGDIERASGSEGWFALDTIRFVPDGRYTRNSVTPVNGWTHYGGEWAPGSYVQVDDGRIFTQGLMRSGTWTNGTQIFDIPDVHLPSAYLHIATRSNGWGYMGVENRTTSPQGVVAKAQGNAYLTVTASFHPASYTGWNNLTLSNGWVWYGSIYSTPQYTKSPSDNMVSLKGLLNSGSASVGSTITTLPSGYRPKERILYTTAAAALYCRIDILPSGVVTNQSGCPAWISLDGVTFLAEQ